MKMKINLVLELHVTKGILHVMFWSDNWSVAEL